MIKAQKYTLMGCPCYAVIGDSVELDIYSLAKNTPASYSVAINAEKILKYSKDSELKKIINESSYPYPDGAGAVLSLKWLFAASSEKINMPIKALEVANEKGLSVCLIGAKEDINTAE